jgi:STE24 endopeptidase
MNEDKATRYHRRKRQAGVVSMAWTTAILAGILLSGLSVSLRAAAAAAAQVVAPGGAGPWVEVLLYVTSLIVITEAASLPLRFYDGFVLERRYGLSRETATGWGRDQIKSLTLALVVGGAGGSVLYWCIRWSASYWWLGAGTLFAAAIIGLATLAPVALLPLFYTLKPLERESLRIRLLALADRAGAKVLGVFEWGLADKTSKANAALTGLGVTRRILVSDTMLADYSDDEIEVVLAHELAHHVHGDLRTGLMVESAVLLAGCFVAARVLETLAEPLGLAGRADVAGLPLLLLAAGGASLVAMPAVRAVSRAHERRADRFALALTRNPEAFVSAMKRLSAQNMAEEHPPKLVEWLFHSHPPISERIAAARAFRPDV